MAIRLVVFDVSGTTWDDRGVVRTALHDAIAAVGPDLKTAVMAGVEGLDMPMAVRMLLEGHGREDLFPRIPEIMGGFTAHLTDHITRAPDVRPIPGTTAMFGALRAADVRVALGTELSRPLLDLLIERLGWGGAESPVDAMIATDQVPRGRPWPDMIDRLREQLGVREPGDVAKVGDTPVDLQEGTVARCGLVIGVCTGGHTREALSHHPHDAILESAAGVPTLVVSHAH